ncbi:MAG: CBS domain-containing protein [Acidimicrobiales bacterium]
MTDPGFTTPARDLVTRDTVFVDLDDSLRVAARLLWEHDVGLLVVGTAERAEGVLSERDVSGAVAVGLDLDATSVREAMADAVVTAAAADPAYDLALQMLDRGIRHLPVTDDGRVVGVVSLRDLIRPLVVGALTSKPSEAS